MELTFGQQVILTLIGSSIVTSLLTTYLNNKLIDRRLRDQWKREKAEIRKEWERQYRSELLGTFLAKVNSVVAVAGSIHAQLVRMKAIDDILAETKDEELMLMDEQLESLPATRESLMRDRLELMHAQLEHVTFVEEKLMQMFEELSSMIPPWIEDRAFFELWSEFNQAVTAWIESHHLDRQGERAEDVAKIYRRQIIVTASKLQNRVKELQEETLE